MTKFEYDIIKVDPDITLNIDRAKQNSGILNWRLRVSQDRRIKLYTAVAILLSKNVFNCLNFAQFYSDYIA